jgi:hypothetical protein
MFRKVLASLVSLFLCLTTQVMADVPYVSSGMVTLSGGSPTATLTGLAGQSTCTATADGTGTYAVEVSQDGTTWVAATVYTPAGVSSLTFTGPGTVSASTATYPYARLHLTAGTGGASYIACGAGPIFIASSGGGGGGNVTVTNFPNPQNVNVTQWGGATVGAATAAGTSATGNIVGVQGVTGGVPIATSVTFPSTIGVTQSTSPWVSSIPGGVNVNNFPATQAVSGTVTANAGTGFPSATAAGTSGTSLTTVQGSTSGVPIPISGTITTTPSGIQNVNQFQMGGATLGAATAIGTTASGNVQGVQGTTGGVPLPVSGSVSVSNFPATQPVSGTVTALQGTTPWTVGGSTGTLTQTANGLKVDGSAVTQPVSGTVTANAGTGTFTVAGTVTANAGTGFPSVTAAGTSGTSLTTIQGSPTGVPIPVSGTFTPSGTQNVQGLGTAGTPTGGVLTTQTQDTSATGSLAVTTVGNNVQETLGAGQGTVGVQLTGTSSGVTFSYEGSVDGTNFVTISCINITTGTVANNSSSASLPVTMQCNTSGLLKFGVFVTNAGTGGPITATFQNTSTGGAVTLANSLPAGTATIGAVTTGSATNSDGVSGSTRNGAQILGYNGTTWDRIRTSTVGTSIASGSVGVLGIQGVSGGVAVSVNGIGTAGTPNAGVQTVQGITGMTPISVTSTPVTNLKTVLTSSSATACTNIEVNTSGTLVEIANSSVNGLTVTVFLYDEGAGPSCANADLMYSAQLAAGQVVLLNIPVGAGISYSLSGALTAGGNITVVRR